MIDFLIILLKPALHYTDDKSTPWWRLDLLACALAAFILDVLIAHTTWALMYGGPKRGEWTFIQVLTRLIERGDWRGETARYLKRVLDAMATSGLHIKLR